jgi:NAD(P)-dependent dehydrogenase (short-subunit alcohol dehydrogenase family)
MVLRAVNDLGRLDLLVSNAGTPGTRKRITPPELDLITEELWSSLLQTNLLGVFRCAKSAAPALRAAHGAIVNTASIAGLIGLVTSSAYVAAKHGVIGLTKTAALEYADAKIRVNAVCPGFIKTQMTEETMRRRGEAIMAQIPLRRMGEPGEIAEMVVWLCSDRASYVTGAAYNVDGGWMAV